jgi:hypothetical protein
VLGHRCRGWIVAFPFLYIAFVRLLQLLRLSRRGQQDLIVEVVMLRHEVAVLRRQVARPALRPSDRAVLAGFSRLLSAARRGRPFVRPETLLRWHRDLVRRRWTYSHRRPGRPALTAGTVSVVLRLARENPTWGLSLGRYRQPSGGVGHPTNPQPGPAPRRALPRCQVPHPGQGHEVQRRP